jgi:hypothetical protein
LSAPALKVRRLIDWQDGVFPWCVFGAVRASISFGGAGALLVSQWIGS